MLVHQLPDLDLNLVDLRDMSTLVISDVSTYLTIPTSDQIALQITPPGGYPTVNVPFTPGSVNVYKCVDLGLTCSDSGCTPLPDGIYTITYTIISSATQSNNQNATTASITKKFIRVDEIKCAYEHAFIALDMNCHNDNQRGYMADLDRAKLYISGCIAEANRGNDVLSFKYYQKAEFILNTLACRYTVNCNDRAFFCGCGCK